VNQIVPDLVAATAAGRAYMPVIWPGFYWTNLHSGRFNQIPHNGGNFLLAAGLHCGPFRLRHDLRREIR
jgi:hypothetical protein